eukprot:PhF_6_TR11691/c1_g1_i2/m.18975
MSRDEAFCAFFRIPCNTEGPPHVGTGPLTRLDLLSLLACYHQGIEASELLHHPSGPGTSTTYTEDRRLAKLRILEQERHTVSVELLSSPSQPISSSSPKSLNGSTLDSPTASVSSKKSKTRLSLGAELVALVKRIAPPQSGMHQQPLAGLYLANEDERLGAMELVRQVHEAEDRKMLALSRSRGVLTVTHAKQFGQGEEEIVKLRNRQLRFVAKEVQKEIEGQKLQSKMHEDDERRQEQIMARQSQLEHEALDRQEKRTQRLEEVKTKNEKRYFKAKQKADEYDKKVVEREEHRQELLRAKAEEQREKAAQRLALVKHRAMLVQQDTEVRSELLAQELKEKQILHEERKVNLRLRQDTQRELSRIRDLHHNIALREWEEKQQVLDEVAQVELYKKYAQQDQRLNNLLENMKSHSEDIHTRVETKQEIAERRRAMATLEKLQRRQQRLQRTVQRDVILQESQETLESRHQAHLERMAERRKNNEENRHRLEKLQEYKIHLQEEKVRQMQERMECVEIAKKRHYIARQAERQRLADQKHGLLLAIHQLRAQQVRNGPNLSIDDPELFMRQQIESMEETQRRTPRSKVPRNVFSQISWEGNNNAKSATTPGVGARSESAPLARNDVGPTPTAATATPGMSENTSVTSPNT